MQSQGIQIAELWLSVRDSQPYPLLTHSFYRSTHPPTLIDLDDDFVVQAKDEDYWTRVGPRLHFIADEVFERTQVDPLSFAKSIGAGDIKMTAGVLLDCGWSREFSLPTYSEV